MKHFFLLSVILLLLISCNKNDVYMQYSQVQNGEWHKDSLFSFDIDVAETSITYNLYVNIRNRSEYPYQNLWLFVKTIQPDSIVTRDTIEFYLADNNGKWLGTGVGAAYEMPVLYRQNLQFSQKGIYNFNVIHGMRDTVLKGINDVGMRLEKL